jgi:hypothetical protein
MGKDCSSCGGGKRERWVVTLPNGMKVTKSSEAVAKSFADNYPGATYVKLG